VRGADDRPGTPPDKLLGGQPAADRLPADRSSGDRHQPEGQRRVAAALAEATEVGGPLLGDSLDPPRAPACAPPGAGPAEFAREGQSPSRIEALRAAGPGACAAAGSGGPAGPGGAVGPREEERGVPASGRVGGSAVVREQGLALLVVGHCCTAGWEWRRAGPDRRDATPTDSSLQGGTTSRRPTARRGPS